MLCVSCFARLGKLTEKEEGMDGLDGGVRVKSVELRTVISMRIFERPCPKAGFRYIRASPYTRKI